MLMRAAKVLGMDTESAAAHSFSDKAQISDWAGQAVSYVSQIGVMNGVDGNAFAPLNPYTREQSIMTLLRLFRASQTI